MNHFFNQWCKAAVSEIRYRPDQEAVYCELYDHLEDLYDAATERGLTPEQAREEALKAMGNPRELAHQFAAIHRPWLGYLLNVTRCVLFVFCFVALLTAISFFRDETWYQPLDSNWYYTNPGEPLEQPSEWYHGVDRRVLDLEPKVSTRCDGFTFKVIRTTMILKDHYDENEQDGYELHILLKVSSLFQRDLLYDIPNAHFWVVDSLGNTYYNDEQYGFPSPCVRCRDVDDDLFSKTIKLSLYYLQDFCSQEAEWVEICYNRNGRNIRLRIDLTGGDGK